ncbi:MULTISPECIES: DNA primase [Bacillus]|jgi:DNA primase|uniref:DNA primase n=1 Tax=Bacillus pacificus TaxID=2026187 RepID=A0A1J9YRQ9_9BACI|nr:MULTISPECIES: DNA primase [Bacillus]AFQ10640.1 DNA primase [Bacillus cereus FRI-35]ASI79616.1 DNA primase [Bacillus cereus]KMQ35058.1 DNA primase [Bacillus cereus]KXI45788.1 DNA primase [Bacillus cereus]KXX98938.1 DNA primase [Bacillus cereus]
MGNRIPEEVVEQIRTSSDIVEVIGEYVQLRKQGRNYFGLCPFHGENSPSFSVSSDKQIFHCFGCGEGGNVFSFLMKMEGLAFTEAVQKLGERNGIAVAEYTSGQGQQEDISDDTVIMQQAHELLKKYYHHLLVNTEEGNEALSYLLKRGITKEMIEKFEIGYASPAWDAATKILQKRGLSLSSMEQAGLLIRSEKDGSHYDRFRGRVMFPIYTLQGKVIAFSGRALGDDTPKYLNSPETPIFHKSKLLYNFHQARPFIRKRGQVVLFEGYADVLAAVKSGVEEAVATMGTALTEEQAKLLRRNVETVVLCYDGDKAGREATMKAGQLLLQVGCQVKVTSLPDKLDPDEYVQQYGTTAFENLVKSSISFVGFKINHLRLGKNLQDESGKEEYVKSVLKELSLLQDAMQAESYLKSLSQEFSYSMETLLNQLHQYRKEQKVQQKQVKQVSKPSQIVQAKPKLTGFERAEREIIYHMLQSPEVAVRMESHIEDFHTEEHKGILYELYAYYEKGNEPSVGTFLSWLSDEKLKNIITDISTDEFINPEYTEEVLQGHLETLRRHQEKLEKMEIIFKIKQMEKTDPVEAAKYYVAYLQNQKARK